MQYFNQTNILWHTLTIFLLIGALMGFVLALLLLFKPHLVVRVNQVANHWVSTRHISEWVDRSISIEHWFYRHHRLLGLFIVLAAGYILVYFGLLFDKTAALKVALSTYVPNRLLLDTLLQAFVPISLIAAAVAFFVGLAVWLRPSLLRGLEKEANQWVSTRRATKIIDMSHDQVDPFIERHAQRVGWLLLVGSIYLFFVMFRWLV